MNFNVKLWGFKDCDFGQFGQLKRDRFPANRISGISMFALRNCFISVDFVLCMASGEMFFYYVKTSHVFAAPFHLKRQSEHSGFHIGTISLVYFSAVKWRKK